MAKVIFSSSAPVHCVCHCGAVIYCSDAEPWLDESMTELDYGWCFHVLDDGAPSAVSRQWPDGTTHVCQPGAGT